MTFGEILSRAAVNTCLGMGTVFVMLILISAIIFYLSIFLRRLLPCQNGKRRRLMRN